MIQSTITCVTCIVNLNITISYMLVLNKWIHIIISFVCYITDVTFFTYLKISQERDKQNHS